MKKAYLLIAFLVLLLAALVYFFGGATSVVPGWHTTIYPPYYSWLFIAIIMFFFAGIGYWLFIKKVSRLNWLLFIFYSLITTATYFFIKFPTVFITYEEDDQEKSLEAALTMVRLLPVANWVLIITQIVFVVYVSCLIIIQKKQRRI